MLGAISLQPLRIEATAACERARLRFMQPATNDVCRASERVSLHNAAEVISAHGSADMKRLRFMEPATNDVCRASECDQHMDVLITQKPSCS